MQSPAGDMFMEFGRQSLETKSAGTMRSLQNPATDTTISSPTKASSTDLRLEVNDLLNDLEDALFEESMMLPAEPEEKSGSEYDPEAAEEEDDQDEALRESRYLQTKVQTPAGDQIAGEAVMRREADYVANVFIGARDKNYLGLNTAFKAPQPPDGSALILDVLIWEAAASPKPQIAQLELHPRGDSKKASFPFRTAANNPSSPPGSLYFMAIDICRPDC